ncbi:MAG: TatD family hydrolase [Bacilli bacterium]
MFTDTHCHLYGEYYENIEKIIEESTELGVNRYINNAVDLKTIKEVLELTSKYPNMFAAIGIHPEEVDNYQDSDLKYLEEHLKDPNVIAIGEIGLDYYYTKENKEKQIILFRKQLELAEKYNLPVVIHSREATQDTIDILKEYRVKGVIHSFSGSYETACIYIKMGYLIGVNGVITFKNAKIFEVIEKIPKENIVLETDSPYLTPVPYRGNQNFPGRVLEIASYVSNLYGISTEELAFVTNQNIKRIFDI